MENGTRKMTPASKGGSWIRPAKRLAIYMRDGMCCAFCGHDNDLTLDHLQAAMLGGGNEATNLITCCRSCNSSKQDQPMRVWFRMLRDRGIDTDGLSAKIRRHTSRKLDRKAAKEILANR